MSLTLNARAHKVVDMDLEYNSETEILSVYFIHGVSDPDYHNVGKIVVKVDGSTILTNNYDSQASVNIGHYEYHFTAHAGQEIEVIMSCTLAGVYSESIIVDEEHEEHKGSFLSALPAAYGAAAITAVILVIPLILNKKPSDEEISE